MKWVPGKSKSAKLQSFPACFGSGSLRGPAGKPRKSAAHSKPRRARYGTAAYGSVPRSLSAGPIAAGEVAGSASSPWSGLSGGRPVVHS